MLDLLQTLEEDGSTCRSLHIYPTDSAVLYVTEPQIMLTLGDAAHFYVANSAKSLPFHTTSFYSTACAALLQLFDFYEKHVSTEYLSFATFTTVKFQGLPGALRTVKQLFLNNMRLFEYESHEKKKR